MGVKQPIAAELDRVSGNPVLPCARQGPGLMIRQEDGALLDWFNPALATLMKSPDYRAVCRDLEEVHGKKIMSASLKRGLQNAPNPSAYLFLLCPGGTRI